jgi:hypothetical protein
MQNFPMDLAAPSFADFRSPDERRNRDILDRAP